MNLGKVEISSCCFQILVSEKNLDGTRISPVLKHMGGIAVSQSMGRDMFRYAGKASGLLTGVPKGLAGNGPVNIVSAWE